MGWYNEDDGDNGYRLDHAGKMIGIVMTLNLRMATIGTVGASMPWTTGIPLMIQATMGGCSCMDRVMVRTMMMSTATAIAAASICYRIDMVPKGLNTRSESTD